MTMPRFDIDLDKHYKPTVVIACAHCGYETRQRLLNSAPSQPLQCRCGAEVPMTDRVLAAARQQADAIKAAYHIR